MFSIFSCCQACAVTGDEVRVDQSEGEVLPRTFTCTLRREAQLGMDCGVYHSSLEIVKIGEEGDAHKYNAGAPDSARLIVGDHITAVNGERDPEKMLIAMREGATLQAEIVRPLRFSAKVARQPESAVGVKIVYSSTSAGISIKSLATGCVEGYNGSASEESKVRAGDLIVDLNGVGASGKKMAAVMKNPACSELDFSIMRLGA